MPDLLELAVGAAASGCIYGLIALAYLLMIRPTGIINFAVGEWAMVAAFGGHLLLSRYEWPYALGMAAIIAFMLVTRWPSRSSGCRSRMYFTSSSSTVSGRRNFGICVRIMPPAFGS